MSSLLNDKEEEQALLQMQHKYKLRKQQKLSNTTTHKINIVSNSIPVQNPNYPPQNLQIIQNPIQSPSQNYLQITNNSSLNNIINPQQNYLQITNTSQTNQIHQNNQQNNTNNHQSQPASSNGYTSTYVLKKPQSEHQNYQHANRLHVTNIPESLDLEDFKKYFQYAMTISGGLLEPGIVVANILPYLDRKFVYIVFRSIEETSAALQLDGLLYKGKALKIKRIKEYEQCQKVEGLRPVPVLDLSRLSILKISNVVKEGPLKMFIQGVAPDWEEEFLISLLQRYGELKSFSLIKDKLTGNNKGYAFFEYQTEQQVQECIDKLNGQKLCNRTIQVKRNTPSQNEAKLNIEMPSHQEENNYIKALDNLGPSEISCILQIKNMIRVDQIEDDEEFIFVLNDILQQFNKIGKVKKLIIPRLKEGFRGPSIGKVYVEFENEIFSQIGYVVLQGKIYDGKQMLVQFFEKNKFSDKQF